MSAKLMLEASLKATAACKVAAVANSVSGNLAAGYGGGITVTLIVTLPIIADSMKTIFENLTPAFPLLVSPPTAKVRPEDAIQVGKDLATVISDIGKATTQSVASAGAPSLTFPNAVTDVTNGLNNLSDFITKKFVKPLTF